jgi:hypothetical protein
MENPFEYTEVFSFRLSSTSKTVCSVVAYCSPVFRKFFDNIFYPNPDKPEPKLNAKTKTETNKIEFGTQELIKVKTYSS